MAAAKGKTEKVAPVQQPEEGKVISTEGSEKTEDAELSENVDKESDEDTYEEDVKKHLTAMTSILYESHLYNVGDILPAQNTEMVEAWIEAGTAKFITEKREA